MSEKYEVVKGTRSKRWQTISLRQEVFLKLKKIISKINISELEKGEKTLTISSIINMALTSLQEKYDKSPPFFSDER